MLDCFLIMPQTYAHMFAQRSYTLNTATATRNSAKRSTNVYLTASLVDKARSMDMNLSATLDTLLAQTIEAKYVEREEEKNDMQAMNQFMAKAGMQTDDDFFGSL